MPTNQVSSQHLAHNKPDEEEEDEIRITTMRLTQCDNQNKQIDSGNSQGIQDEDEEEDDYLQDNRTTEAQTMMHILKANIGTGVLAMPLAFKNVGLWLGLVLVPLIGGICIHCMNILIESHNKLCDRFNYESLDYDQVAALGLASGPRWARRLAKHASFTVTLFLMFTQIGFCCVYILFTVENIQVACGNLFHLDYSLLTYLFAVFPIIGLTSCTSNLKHLARISTLANCLQLFGLALIFFDLLQFHTYALVGGSDQAEPAPPHIRVEQGANPQLTEGLPLFFATAVYAFEGIGVVLPLVKEMRYPGRISGPAGVLNTSMMLVALLYMAMGFFGYSKYGQTVAGSITLNLPERTLNELVRLAFALAIGLSYSLQFYVPWTIVWPLIDESLFYSYRPRKPRDKLSILSKLSAENHWTLREAMLEEERQQKQSSRRSSISAAGGGGVRRTKPPMDHSTSLLDQQQQQYNDNSMASTLATSYTISMVQQQQQQYGATPSTKVRHARNRLDDVMEHNNSHSDSESIPEVRWRPPPRSMRGMRKLVRYTIILLTVSFTFVAAALIPRLDLFISLIGALASSCLAIIFPAIIQLCTFWNYLDDDEDENEQDERADNDQHDATGSRTKQEGDDDDDDDEHCLCTTTKQLLLAPAQVNCRHCKSVGQQRQRRQRKLRKRLTWHLFVIKNIFLLLFGVLGLITGSWVSLRQLGVAGAADAATV